MISETTTRDALGADLLAGFLAEERERYGAPPPLRWRGGRAIGFAVTAAQRGRLAALLPKSAAAVGVLEDPADPRTTLSFHCVDRVEPLRAAPSGALASEVQPWDPPIRRLRCPAVEGQVLVQTACRTLGWMRACLLEEVEASAAAEAFLAPRRALKGAAARVAPGALAALTAAAEDLACRNLRYKLGGRDERRWLDCSALTQLLFARCCGLWLPRHSRDQRRMGRRVPQGEVGPGCLVFASHRERGLSHVALALSSKLWVHACLDEGRVLRQTRSEFAQRYRVRIARRIGEEA